MDSKHRGNHFTVTNDFSPYTFHGSTAPHFVLFIFSSFLSKPRAPCCLSLQLFLNCHMFSCKIFYLLPPWLLSLVIYFVFSNHQSVQLHSHVQLFVTPWTAARQASLYYQLKLMSTESVMPSDHVILCHPLLLPSGGRLMEHPASGSFPMSQFFKSGGQSIRVSASASVLPMNIQDWFPLEWTGWISLQSKGTTESLGLSRVFSNTTVQRHQFFSTQLSLQSSFHIHTWPMEKP